MKEHYETVKTWWEFWKWPAVPPPMLPRTGFIIEDADGQICAGWLYKTDSKWAVLEWIISSPKARGMRRKAGLDHLIRALVDEAERMGFEGIFTNVRHAALISRYEKHGFAVTDRGMTNMVYSKEHQGRTSWQ